MGLCIATGRVGLLSMVRTMVDDLFLKQWLSLART